MSQDMNYRCFFEQSRDALYATSRDGTITDVNPSALILFGYTREEMIGLDVRELYANSLDRERFQREIEHRGCVQDYEVRLRRRDGTELDCLLTSTVCHGDDKSILGYQGIIRDITEHRRTEEALRLSGEKFSMIFRSSPDWIAISTLFEGRFIDVNDAFQQITGYTREEVIGRSSLELGLWVDPGEREKTVKILLEKGEMRNQEVRFRLKSGEVLTMLRSAELINLAGKPCVINVTRDITERKRFEERIQNLNRELQQRVIELTEANKELAAFTHSVSHDLRSPLIVITGFSRLLLKECGDGLDAEHRGMLSTIQNYAQRMERLIDDLLTFSRLGRRPVCLSEIDMEELTKAAFEELRPTVSERAVSFAVKALPPAQGDLSMMRQVLVNLLSNALKYSSRRERAVIEVGGSEKGGEVVYSVKDNGVGFDMRDADKLFAVFQRLHREEEFEGTGVGLSIVQRVIERHGGRVWAEARVGDGATFYFTLPRAWGRPQGTP